MESVHEPFGFLVDETNNYKLYYEPEKQEIKILNVNKDVSHSVNLETLGDIVFKEDD